MESTDDAALNDRPEALNRIGVNRADNVLGLGVVDGGMRITGLAEVANRLIGAEQANLVRDCLANEILQRRSANIGDNASDHQRRASR